MSPIILPANLQEVIVELEIGTCQNCDAILKKTSGRRVQLSDEAQNLTPHIPLSHVPTKVKLVFIWAPFLEDNEYRRTIARMHAGAEARGLRRCPPEVTFYLAGKILNTWDSYVIIGMNPIKERIFLLYDCPEGSFLETAREEIRWDREWRWAWWVFLAP